MPGTKADFDRKTLEEIQRLKSRVGILETRESYRIFEGTSFPAGLVVGDYFYRNDITVDLLFRKTTTVFDGDKWLSVPEYHIGYGQYDIPLASSPETLYFGRTRYRTGNSFAIFYSAYSILTQVDAPNNGANYWTIQFTSWNGTLGAATNVYDFNTSTDGVGVVSRNGFPIDDQTPAGYGVAGLIATATGSPGQLTVIPELFYKILGDP